MKGKFVSRTAVVVSVSVMLSGCAVTPENCQLNQTATGAAVGAGVGAALGGLGAALGGARGGVGLGIAAGAMLVGAAIGAAIGHQQDMACHQLAVKQALDLAMAERAAWQQRQQEYEDLQAQQQSQPKAHMRQSATLPEPPKEPVYMTVAWANSMTNTTGAITPLNSYTDAASNRECSTTNDTKIVNGQTETISVKYCRKPNGDWEPAN